jgi:hypothetical protein
MPCAQVRHVFGSGEVVAAEQQSTLLEGAPMILTSQAAHRGASAAKAHSKLSMRWWTTAVSRLQVIILQSRHRSHLA